MSSDLVKILRSLKGHSDHRDRHSHHDRYANHYESCSKFGHHYKSHGKHLFSGFAYKVTKELSGKLLKNKRLALLVIIALMTFTAVFLVCAVWFAVALIKLCGPLISDFEQNGLRGVVETISKIITRIWEGSGK